MNCHSTGWPDQTLGCKSAAAFVYSLNLIPWAQINPELIPVPLLVLPCKDAAKTIWSGADLAGKESWSVLQRQTVRNLRPIMTLHENITKRFRRATNITTGIATPRCTEHRAAPRISLALLASGCRSLPQSRSWRNLPLPPVNVSQCMVKKDICCMAVLCCTSSSKVNFHSWCIA